MLRERLKLWQRNNGRWRTGGSLIEMVVSFNVLLFLAFGMVDFGQFFYIRHAFEAAARDGCRQAILPTATQAQVVTTMTNTLQQANVTYNSSWLTMTQSSDGVTFSSVSDCSTVTQGNVLSITLSATYNLIPNAVRPLYSITGQGIKNGKVITAESTMVKE